MPGLKSYTRFVAGASTLALVLGVASAEAQNYPVPYGYPPVPPQAMYSPHHADAVVRSLGLMPLGPATPHGPMLIVQAIGQEGSRIQVMLERRTGRIVQIARVGRSAPRMVTIAPGHLPPDYDVDDDAPEFFDDDLPSPVARRGYPYGEPAVASGPAVITRDGIWSEALPPPRSGARMAERQADITGSVPRAGRTGSVDPLRGVPKEFRGDPSRDSESRQRIAARSPADTIPRSAPLPLPRPADASKVAQTESRSEPTPASAKPHQMSPEAKKDAEKFPPVQPLE
jgi:hypothetical protein